MKLQILTIFCFLFGYNFSYAFANWNDLEVGQIYQSQYKFDFQDSSLEKDRILELNTVDADSGIYIRFEFIDIKCTNINLESELILFSTPNYEVKDIGIKQDTGCQVNFYIEPYQYYDKAVFSELALPQLLKHQ